MQKYWGVGILLGVVLLALGVISIFPETPATKRIYSGMAVNVDYCKSSCGSTSKFFYKQTSSPYNPDSYTINVGDYFMVSVKNLTSNIVAIYRYDGIDLTHVGALLTSKPYEDTGNYLKLSLVYSKVSSLTTIDYSYIIDKFNCIGRPIIVPIVNPGYVGKDIGIRMSQSAKAHYLANVQLKPSEHINQVSGYYNVYGKQVSDYAIAAILIRGVNPIGVDKDYIGKSSLLVDVDGDGAFGGEVTYFGYRASGICDDTVYRGNTLDQRSTSYRGAGSAYN